MSDKDKTPEDMASEFEYHNFCWREWQGKLEFSDLKYFRDFVEKAWLAGYEAGRPLPTPPTKEDSLDAFSRLIVAAAKDIGTKP